LPQFLLGQQFLTRTANHENDYRRRTNCIERSISSATPRAVNELTNLNGTAVALWCKTKDGRISAERFQSSDKTFEPSLGGLRRVFGDSIRGGV
jgi:hypothetical protein